VRGRALDQLGALGKIAVAGPFAVIPTMRPGLKKAASWGVAAGSAWRGEEPRPKEPPGRIIHDSREISPRLPPAVSLDQNRVMNILETGRAARVGVGLVAGIFLSAGLNACKRGESAAGNAPAGAATNPGPAAATKTNAPAAAPKPIPEALQKLFGKWMRSDGTYVLELRGADISGVLDAGYFNPKSINVSRAIWMQGAAGLQVMVELNDVGYPGATYVLTHDTANDRLVGKYTQPQMQQTFDIDFVRQAKP
jgi:hypothetical protein